MLDPYVLLVPADDPLALLERRVGNEDLAGRELVGKDTTSPSQRALEATLARTRRGKNRRSVAEALLTQGSGVPT